MGGAFPKTHQGRQPRPPGQERPEADSGQQTPARVGATARPAGGGCQPSSGGGAVGRGGGARGAGREQLGEEPRGGAVAPPSPGSGIRPSVSLQGAASALPATTRLTRGSERGPGGEAGLWAGASAGGPPPPPPPHRRRPLRRVSLGTRGKPAATPRPACSWSPLATGRGETAAGSRCVGRGSTESW